jgi:hypothetical protein
MSEIFRAMVGQILLSAIGSGEWRVFLSGGADILICVGLGTGGHSSMVAQTFLSVSGREVEAFLPPEPTRSVVASPLGGQECPRSHTRDRQECLPHQKKHPASGRCRVRAMGFRPGGSRVWVGRNMRAKLCGSVDSSFEGGWPACHDFRRKCEPRAAFETRIHRCRFSRKNAVRFAQSLSSEG